jgi:IclR family transcriptional regulator, pca regulon regulatory protein
VTGKSADEFVGSFAKGLRVLRAFGADHPSMTLTEVAERAGLTRAAARRFLLTLTDLGYAAFDGKRFSLTARVLELGFVYLRSLRLPELVMPYLRRVSEALAESSSASVLDGGDVVYVARIQTRRIMSADLGVGARLPAVSTSMGRVLLANLEPVARAAALKDAVLEKHTRHSITSKARLRTVLDDVRARGYSIVDQELEEGLRSIAVPIRGREGRVVAAMNVSSQANRVSVEAMERTFLPVLQRAAADVSDALVHT